MGSIWIDVTAVLQWQRPAVGIIRVESECAQCALGMKNNNIRFCRYDGVSRIYREVDRQALQISLDRIHSSKNADASTEMTQDFLSIDSPVLSKEDKIKATMATSYINDSATGYSIQKKLIEVANILFMHNELLQQIGETNHETK